jgi:hypothetical protein
MNKREKSGLEELNINPSTAKFRHRTSVENANLSVENSQFQEKPKILSSNNLQTIRGM